MGLTRLAIQRPLVVLTGLFGLVLLGIVSYTRLPVALLPPVSISFVNVNTTYGQASAQDVEQLVTEPIENALAGLPDAQTISSISSAGLSTVSIQLVQNANADAAALRASQLLAAVRNQLPAAAGQPTINEADPNAVPIMNIGLTGAPLDQLYQIATTQFQPQLESVPGVASVTVTGGLQRQVQILVDPAKLAAYNLTVQQVDTAISAANVTAPAGTVQRGAQLLDIRTVGGLQTLGQLQDLVIAQTAAGPVYLSDVATVQEGDAPQTQSQRLNGQDAVGLVVVKNSSANTLQVANGVRQTLQHLQPLLPAGAQVQVTNDYSTFIQAALDAIESDLLLAIFLVGAVMLLFLHEWKNTLIVILAIPTSLISTFLVMYLLGFTLNLMTLTALALVIGILVDDSIVILENIQRHLQMGKSPWQAALDGRSEIGPAAIAITLVDVVVYVPIAFMAGIVGELFLQFGLTVVAATLFSLLVSFTLTPMLASRWLQHTEGGSHPLARFGRWWDAGFDRLGDAAAGVVPAAIRARWLIVLVSLLLAVATVAMIPLQMIGTEYVPQEDDNNFQVTLVTPPGTSLQATDQDAKQMEAALRKIPEVVDVFSSVSVAAPGGSGGGGGGGGGGVFTGGKATIAVQLVPKAQRSRSVFDIIKQVRQLGNQILGVTVKTSVASPFGGGAGGAVNIVVEGPVLSTLNQVANHVMAAASQVPGLVDLQNTSQAGTPEVDIVLDQTRMAQLGVTAQQVSSVLQTIYGGNTVSAFRPTGQPQQDIVVIAPEAARTDLTQLAAIPVSGGAGGSNSASSNGAPLVTLGQIATITPGSGQATIQRVDRSPAVTIAGTAFGVPLGNVASDLQAALKTAALPAGYIYKLSGQVSLLNVAVSELGQALILALVLEYMLLVALYNSWLFPLVRMLAVPLGLIGSFVALYLTGNTINIFSIIGLIMAEGLVGKNAILLIDYANQLRERGIGRTDALALAARTRLRPILMTSATMIIGMMPLALKFESGAEYRSPLAVVVIGGMFSSTILALVVIPAVYTLFDDLQAHFAPAKPVPALPELAPATADGGSPHPDRSTSSSRNPL